MSDPATVFQPNDAPAWELQQELHAVFSWDYDAGREKLLNQPKERARVRRHFQAWQVSQFLHGEQGALICTSKIVQQVPHMDAKFYAATQVVDEARHVEAFSLLLHEKFDLVYSITGLSRPVPGFSRLVGHVPGGSYLCLRRQPVQRVHRGPVED